MGIPPDLALEGKRFKEELADAGLAGGIFVSSGQFRSVFARLLSFPAIVRSKNGRFRSDDTFAWH
ncbi:hypothetical protein FJV83_26670 [Mesorhizobium sp. WSM4307]|uniref:hypothetical protein n=1 Tax=unclassified Mesorhizobium TaxID=325217 RepID=UPI00115D2502|nr:MULTISPECIES: hypothetical protein [unclassified Mesorhizobium]TRC74590.1 hypothetical protein FJV81_21170 [Mesorhizobium sp. WSM4315]TRC80481.1 hypothetical protein FJV83_26670 [Mesorhizobium sp. WSM4307]TRC89164.1 hypothetical protein FJV80_10475 [Mesorhizobium sp. WSM4310]